MTELEYEKACRGPLPAVAGEYAWGNVVTYTISGLQGTDGSGEEYYNTGNLHATGTGGPSGPIRAGIFARPGPGSTREASGAGYWGIMQLSGNVYERSVTIGNAQGRAFTGLHGDGKLTAAGAADVGSWPVGGAGAGFRGGCWNITFACARASDRRNAAHANATRTTTTAGAVAGRRRQGWVLDRFGVQGAKPSAVRIFEFLQACRMKFETCWACI